MRTGFDIAIRGAGVVGRTLALHLARHQLRVAVVDKPDADHPPQADIRAFALNHASRQLLEAVRCWPDAPHVTPVTTMQVFGDEGGSVAFTAAQAGVEALHWVVEASALQAQLAQAQRFQPLIEHCTQAPDAALTVVCEGKSSPTRQALGLEWDVHPYHQRAIATRIEASMAHQQTARQWFSDGEILALLPVGSAQGQGLAVVWSLPEARAQALADASEAEFCQALHDASHGQLGALQLRGARQSWPLQHALARRWSGRDTCGAWVLAGDAAHTLHPLAGQGLNLGLADVACLASILGQRPYWRTVDDGRLMRQYERSRKAAHAVTGQTNDVLHQIFMHPHPALQGLRNWGMNQFDHVDTLKAWVAQMAMGGARLHSSTSGKPS